VFCVQALSDASESVGGERVSQGGARGRAVEQVRGGLIERVKREKREKREERRERREKRENFYAKTRCDQSVTSRF
jgi:hypothetical protein